MQVLRLRQLTRLKSRAGGADAYCMPYTDFVKIAPGLFLGSHPEEEDAFVHGPSTVICLSERASTAAPPKGMVYLHWYIKDGPVPDADVLGAIVDLINTRLRSDGSVFVHCDAGMNRSALVVASALVGNGMLPADAIETVRSKRPGALSDDYEAWLLGAGSR